MWFAFFSGLVSGAFLTDLGAGNTAKAIGWLILALLLGGQAYAEAKHP